MKKLLTAIIIIAVIAFIYVAVTKTDILSQFSSKASSLVSSNKTPSKLEIAEQKAAQMTIEEFKEAAVSVSYDDLKRNPDDHKGDFIVIKLYVAQIVKDKQWRTYTYQHGEWLNYNTNEEFYLFDERTSGTNIIEKDVITIYGVYRGTVSVQRALTGTTEKVPSIDVFNLELH